MSERRKERRGFFDLLPGWRNIWKGMPAFVQEDLTPFQSLVVHFRSPEDRGAFARLIDRTVTNRTQSVWYPREEIRRYANKRFVSENPLNPRYFIYIISKGRWKSRLTSKILEKMGIPYCIVVEPQEYDEYAKRIDPAKILTLPFSNLGRGSIPARNWVWKHSLKTGAERHWILDDNLRCFYRLADNLKTPTLCGNMFRAAEDFVDRYENVALSGFNYFMFASRKSKVPPLYLNTRIYSCILVRNDLPCHWRGRYNEDTDLSLRVLKGGWCTVLFNAFLVEKMQTMTMKGGNTEELYQGDGRWKMAKSLERQHPDVVTVVRRWGRWQHRVDYRSFRKNKLKLREDAVVLDGIDNYGMYLQVDEEKEESNAGSDAQDGRADNDR